jgi:hypothetical protein
MYGLVDYHIAQELARMIDRDKPEGPAAPSVFSRLLAKVRQPDTNQRAEDTRPGAVSFESQGDEAAAIPC